jgi:hypothetical protein
MPRQGTGPGITGPEHGFASPPNGGLVWRDEATQIPVWETPFVPGRFAGTTGLIGERL